MVPDTPHGTHSQAEKRVFDRLRAACAGEGDYTAYHSLNLTRHAYKRFGEIDFLVCGPLGILALEVKGGKVACHKGYWQYSNRYGEVTESVEGPFRQVESALHGLMATLRDHLPDQVLAQFSIGYGVVFPDCEWPMPSVEWDLQTLADARSFNDFERWLRKLFRYWRGKDGGDRHADDDALNALRHCLRPEFEAAMPLHSQVRGAEERIAALTEDQMVMVDVVAANPRVLCSGGAGTGKTFLAIELCRRWTAEGMDVVLVCRSPWLKSYLLDRLLIPKLTVSLVNEVQIACRRRGVRQFDALIVDEGQDLFDIHSLGSLDSVLVGGLANGRWCFFQDANNQSGFFGLPDQEAVDYLASMQPARVPLRTNCRNTRIILEKVQSSLGADMGTRGAGEGPKIREHHAYSKSEAATLLANEFIELFDRGGLSPGNVTILSPVKFEDSCVMGLPDELRCEIMGLDEYSMKCFPTMKTSFAEIANFKGLENEAIILLDLPAPDKGSKNLAAYYVAMSRARSMLCLIYDDVN